MSSIERHPNVKINLYFSGVLLEVIHREKPLIYAQIKHLLECGQIEILGGGYYDPAFIAIPEEDSVAQILKHRNWIFEHFGVRTNGLLIPDSVWEPRLAGVLAKAGVLYTVLEDTLFFQSGLRPCDLYQPFRTEWLGDGIVAVPFHRGSSSSIPFCPWDESLASFKQMSNRSDTQHFCIVQNGDIYGGWPGTQERIYGDGLLESWLCGLDRENAKVRCSLLRELADLNVPYPLVALPSGMGRSIEGGALPVLAQEEFLKTREDLQLRFDAERFDRYFHAGHWMGFLAKYPESNHLHKKMLWIRRRLESVTDSELRQSILECLWKAQGQAGFGHVEQGGCYANYLRDAMHRALIQADKLLSSALGESGVHIVSFDYDSDRHPELWLRGASVNGVVCPGYGGALIDLCLQGPEFNLLNTFSRRVEPYQRRLKSPPPHSYDWHRRYAFLDHFVKAPVAMEDFESMRFLEYGDFVNQPYQLSGCQGDQSFQRISLVRNGGVFIGGVHRPIRVEKQFALNSSGLLTVTHQITNTGEMPVDAILGVEMNYSLLNQRSDRQYWILGEKRCSPDCRLDQYSVNAIKLVDEDRRFDCHINLQSPARLIHHPISTLGVNGEQAMIDYQGSVFYFLWNLSLGPGETWRHLIELRTVEH